LIFLFVFILMSFDFFSPGFYAFMFYVLCFYVFIFFKSCTFISFFKTNSLHIFLENGLIQEFYTLLYLLIHSTGGDL